MQTLFSRLQIFRVYHDEGHKKGCIGVLFAILFRHVREATNWFSWKGIVKKQNFCLKLKFVEYIDDKAYHWNVCHGMLHASTARHVVDALEQKLNGSTGMVP